MSNALYTRSAGADPYALDVDQFTNTLQGTIDPGPITLAGPTAAPGAPSVTLAAGSLSGSWQWCAWWITGVPVGGSGTPNVNGVTPAGTATATQTLSSQEAVLTVPASPPSTAVGCAFGRTQTGPGTTFYVIPDATVYKTAAGAWPQYTDNTPDSSLTTVVPSTNTTGTPVTFGAGATFNAGISGTGNTGTLTAGTGILGTANTWSAAQTFGAVSILSGQSLYIGGASGNTQLSQPGTVVTVAGVDATLLAAQINGSPAQVAADTSGNLGINGTLYAGGVSASTLKSTVGTGTAPLSVDSTTQVPNLNASYVGGLSVGNISEALTSVTPGTTAGDVFMTTFLVADSSGYPSMQVVYVSGYENDTTTSQTIPWPQAFSYYAYAVTNSTGLSVSATTTGLTITTPDDTSVFEGMILVIGA